MTDKQKMGLWFLTMVLIVGGWEMAAHLHHNFLIAIGSILFAVGAIIVGVGIESMDK